VPLRSLPAGFRVRDRDRDRDRVRVRDRLRVRMRVKVRVKVRLVVQKLCAQSYSFVVKSQVWFCSVLAFSRLVSSRLVLSCLESSLFLFLFMSLS
jgi:hypothetical protein